MALNFPGKKFDLHFCPYMEATDGAQHQVHDGRGNLAKLVTQRYC